MISSQTEITENIQQSEEIMFNNFHLTDHDYINLRYINDKCILYFIYSTLFTFDPRMQAFHASLTHRPENGAPDGRSVLIRVPQLDVAADVGCHQGRLGFS